MKIIKSPTVKLLWHTPEPQRVVALAGRMTYSAMDVEDLEKNLGEAEIKTTVNAILERRHWSCLRHVVFMFAVSGVSRAFSHQLVRHAVGHDYEQRSQHYRLENEFNMVVPTTLGKEQRKEYLHIAQQAQDFYNEATEAGLPKDDARFALPNGVETQLVWTANLEAILNFVQTRACRVNTPEITKVAIAVRNIVGEIFPEATKYLGPTCLTQGVCYEGKKFCKRPWSVPTVLWDTNYPKDIVLVGQGGLRMEIDGDSALKEYGYTSWED